MRFKKGSKVEVLSKREVPSGSWISAEIICGNGHNYTVRYDGHQSNIDEAIVERVPGSAIRPCPPPLEGPEGWIPGDIVEVFDNFSWKMATVSKVLGKKYFLVRHLGSSLEFKVRKYDLRVRQSWQDDKWIVIGKSSGTFDDRKPSGPPTDNYIQNSSFQVQEMDTRMKLSRKDNCFTDKNNADFQESHIASSRTLKRGSPFGYSHVEAYAGAAKKFRLTEKEGRLHRAVAANASLLPEKVEAVASPREMLGENYMHASFNSRPTGYSEMDVERAKTNGAVGCSHAVSLGHNDADSVTCSVGSCSITSNNPYKLLHRFSTGPIENDDCSDAESFCRLGYEEGNFLLPTKEELAAEIHRLELHAYRCTIEALHASGPLSWEQETLVTNLRLSLHISNDEHLMELRNLVSADISIPIS
ncbi:hypothetical protein PVL29_014299 [Vitis rotundifolia]|uniref:ENT domain-containing protein n=1 Tax=Vitis rotundifolia TaxID=103349 RepID=A0AA38ZGV0_VITRO|nr:hypothetical protein PVL29_014299 [Vitis rotundifolia]